MRSSSGQPSCALAGSARCLCQLQQPARALTSSRVLMLTRYCQNSPAAARLASYLGAGSNIRHGSWDLQECTPRKLLTRAPSAVARAC